MGSKPLLTIAIPTWNRAPLLKMLLEMLMPQVAGRPEIEVLVCDNGSTDGTGEVVAGFAGVRVHRHAENVGSDANFVSAFEMARGEYFWLCGDDDLIVPGAVEEVVGHLRAGEYDLVYATSYGYREDWLAERQGDPLGREYHTIKDAAVVARVVNAMFTFISGMIVNRRRWMDLQGELGFEAPGAFVGTHLTQLSWSLPLLRRHRRSLVLWGRPVACRLGHTGGYDLAQIFGEGLQGVARRCLPDRADLSGIVVNMTLRRWFPSMLVEIRGSGNRGLAIEKAQGALGWAFRGNWRYWVFVYPVLALPLGLARVWMRVGEGVSKGIYMLTVPGFWRKRT